MSDGYIHYGTLIPPRCGCVCNCEDAAEDGETICRQCVALYLTGDKNHEPSVPNKWPSAHEWARQVEALETENARLREQLKEHEAAVQLAVDAERQRIADEILIGVNYDPDLDAPIMLSRVREMMVQTSDAIRARICVPGALESARREGRTEGLRLAVNICRDIAEQIESLIDVEGKR